MTREAKDQKPEVIEEGVAQPPSRWVVALHEIVEGSPIIAFLAVLSGILIGGILIAATNEDVQTAASYFFARPGDTFAAIWNSISGAYVALFQGSIFNFAAPNFATGLKSIMSTLSFATPLIAGGLSVALAFRVGLFNIGGQGQILIAAIFAGWVSFGIEMPWGIHMIVAVAAGILGGALWAGIAGFLRARTGAHEVIITIMLNYVAYYLLSYLLTTPILQAPGSTNPKTPPAASTAILPNLFGPNYDVTLGFVLSVIAVVFVWWLMERSSLGFRMRAVGYNPEAARTAGIHVERMYLYAMLFAGGLAGLAGSELVLGKVTTGFTNGIDAGIGFDAITVALLGGSRPWGTFAAGLLFGAFKAGGFTMQAAQGVPLDIVLVMQSVIVLFIAAPPLVRAIFRLPSPGSFKAKAISEGAK